VCGVKCSIEYSNTKKQEKAVKKARIEKKLGHEALMTHSDWKKKLQTIFNTFIRLRDINKGCVSCQTPLTNRKFDAGHYYPTTYEAIRFSELNVHGQCVTCNQYKHANLHEYKKNITNRISLEDLQWLEDNRHSKLKMTIPEIKDQISIYKDKVKEIKKTN
jgi:hypothetical protein|tara:strand:+ start:7222 stop:7704 length:483 start_codon:yes stop_codon:yes gene_type:complete